MAGTDPQKQLLTLIRDFAAEKSQGERRILDLKKQILELRSEQDGVNVQLEDAKRLKEITEQEIKGYEVELAMNEAATQTLEARISLLHDEISVISSDLEALKNEEAASREKFIDKMFELNTNIRKFQETIACTFPKGKIRTSANYGQQLPDAGDIEVTRRDLENKIAQIISQTITEEQECQVQENIHKQVRSCRGGVYVQIVIKIMWRHCIEFFRPVMGINSKYFS
ncbi:hypothetical protein NMG60_11028372 [Bertholletia excelsa]